MTLQNSPIVFQCSNDKLNTVMLDTEYLYLSYSKTYKDATEFRLSAQEGDSMFILCRKISLNKINKIVHEKEEKPMSLDFFFTTEKGKEEERDIMFKETDEFPVFMDYITSLIPIKPKEVTQTKFKATSTFLVLSVISGLLTYFWYINALADQSGGEVIRERGKAGFLINIGILLGRKITPTGLLIAGGLLTALFVYLVIKRFNKPPVDIVYERG